MKDRSHSAAMHRRFFYKALLFFAVMSLYSQISSAQTYQWAKSIKSEGFDQAYDIAADPQGNVYVAGQIEYVADFGNGILLESVGSHDIFVAKYTPAGRLVWAKRAGGRGGDKVHSIALDGLGNIFLGGEFEDTCYFEGIRKVTRIPDINNMFIAKYDTSGNVQWVRNIDISDTLQTRGYSVACDAQGNVYSCGGTKGNTYYENNFLFNSAGDYDAMVVKFNANGDFVWARRMGGPESDKAYGILSDNNGYIYVTGYFVGLAEFGPGVSINGRGGTDIFLAKFDTAGTLQWVEQAGDTGFDRGWDLTLNVNSEIIVTGEFQAHAEMGSNIVHSRGNYDMFLAAYSSAGICQWALSGGGPEDDIGRGVTHDNNGNIFVIGDYGGTATFPPSTINGNGFSEVFLSSYDASGSNLRWLRSLGSYENDRGRGVAADAAGNVFICGEYVDSMQFANITLHGDSLLDMFVTKIVSGNFCSTQLSLTGQISCTGSCNGTALASSNGTGPFTYSWSTSPVQTGAMATGLCAGTYTVVSTDAVGCSSSASITLTSPQATVLSQSTQSASCFAACDGSSIISASGNGPFTYSWSTNPVQTGNSASGLCSGNYMVTSTDANGCTATMSIAINQPAQIQVNLSKTDPSCFGVCDGSALVSANGQGAVTYLWSGAAGHTGSSISGLCDGLYTVTCTDAASCTATGSISINNPPAIQVSTLVNDISCNGLCDGTALVNANGNGPFTYVWQLNPPQSGSSIGSLCAGNYSVVTTDNSNCTTTTTVTILEPSPIQIQSVISNSTCISCADGGIDIQVAGGTGSVQYAWSDGSSNEDLLNVMAGTYSVCVTDINSCMLCDTFQVLAPGTGIASGQEMGLVTVYPNPFKSFIRIRISQNQSGNTQIQLYNAVGEKVYENNLSGNQFNIYPPSLSNGVYFIHLYTENSNERKIIPLLYEK